MINIIQELKAKGGHIPALYVEDEDHIREIYGRVLRQIFDKCEYAANGEEGLQKFMEYRPLIVVTDISMPYMNGLDMAEEIKKIAPETKIFVVTAHSDVRYFQRGIELGIDGYLLKPIQNTQMMSAIRKAIDEISIKTESEHQKRLLINDERIAYMRELLTQIAHHWRQPLNIISLNSQLLEDEVLADSPDKDAIINVAHKNIEVVQALSRSIDRFTKVYDAPSVTTKTDIYGTAKDIRELVTPSMGEDILLEIAESEPIFCTLRKADLQQVLMELISNAIRKLKKIEGGKISISFETNSESVSIIVSDDGGTMSDSMKDRVFEPYFTTEGHHTYEGVGLYITKILVEEKMKGTIICKNTENGVEFRIILPLVSF